MSESSDTGRKSGRVRAAAAVIERDGRLLVGLRLKNDSFGGYWEFPGGKLEPGENVVDCLRRELREELEVECEIGERICVVRPNPGFKLTVHLGTILEGEPSLIEHEELKWATLEELADLRMLPADKPVLKKLRERRERRARDERPEGS